MENIIRKSMLYKTGVEYGDYTLNHVQGCSHGCLYPCYAYMMARRFGRAKDIDDWMKPKLVGNATELLQHELPKLKSKINSVHLCFTTDSFMYGYKEVCDKSIEIINLINSYDIPCTALTKGVFTEGVKNTSKTNSYGITIISLEESFRKQYEPNSAPYAERLDSLKSLHNEGFNTWASIEPYPTPNIIEQDLSHILNELSFVDKIIFGRLNYNKKVREYPNYQEYYNGLTREVINFCTKKGIDYHIKDGTFIE